MAKNKGGRPKIQFNQKQWKDFEKLCELQCTKLEISNFFSINHETLERLIKEKYGEGFSQVFSQKRAGGKISLRRYQFQLAQSSPAMAIFLGKNYLGQADKQEIETHITNYEKISDEELLKIKDELVKSIEEITNGK